MNKEPATQNPTGLVGEIIKMQEEIEELEQKVAQIEETIHATEKHSD